MMNVNWGFDDPFPHTNTIPWDVVEKISKNMDEKSRKSAKKEKNVTDYTNYYKDKKFQIKKVIFSNPATIVLWEDGTKTIVKCGENDIYDPEKGLALCFMKKICGNTSGKFNKVRKKCLDEFLEVEESK